MVVVSDNFDIVITIDLVWVNKFTMPLFSNIIHCQNLHICSLDGVRGKFWQPLKT